MAKAAVKTKPSTSTGARAKTLQPSDRKAVKGETAEERKARLKREASARYYAKKQKEKKAAARASRNADKALREEATRATTVGAIAPVAIDPMVLSRSELLAALKAHRISAMRHGESDRAEALAVAIGLAEQLA